MKALRDNHSLPSNHWTEWNSSVNQDFHSNDNVNEDSFGSDYNDKQFSFINSHKFWEHPAASELAKQSRATHGDLDRDSDHMLIDLFKNAWVKDFHKNIDNLPQSILEPFIGYERIQEKIELNTNIGEAYYAYKNEIEENLENKMTRDEEIDEFMKHLTGDKSSRWRDTRPPMIKKMHEENSHHEQKILPIITVILLAMIETNYQISDTTLREYIIEDDKKKNKDDQYELGDKYILHTALTSGDQYFLNIIAFPGENLPSYFHDEMLYMNYVQNIVAYEGKYTHREKEIVLSEKLLKGTKEEILEFSREAMGYAEGWWT